VVLDDAKSKGKGEEGRKGRRGRVRLLPQLRRAAALLSGRREGEWEILDHVHQALRGGAALGPVTENWLYFYL